MEICENRLTQATFQMLRLRCGMEPLDASLTKTALDASLMRLVCMDGDETIGMARVVGDGAFIFVIADLLIVPERRGEGVGTRIVTHILDAISLSLPDGRWSVVTLVSSSGREAFYERMGFHKLPKGGTGHAMQTFVRGTRQ